MQIADILIHLNEKLGPGQRARVEESLRTEKGVIAPRFSPKRPHLLLVSYNPSQTGSRNLLQRVLADGYHAQMVGM